MSELSAHAAAPPAFSELKADPAWQVVDLVSDLHLETSERATYSAWLAYLASTTADALFILGDLFEVWLGDDAARLSGFEADCAQALQAAAQQRPVYFMHGNRDFLLGSEFAALAGLQLLADPTVLQWNEQRWLLSHGDLLCLDDTAYLAFREQVRTTAWQRAFLDRPLADRRAVAREIRKHSESRKADPRTVWADVDDTAARQWLTAARAQTLIHGHTHRPATHALGKGMQRVVLSDWHAAATPPRAQLLRLSATGAERIDLAVPG